MEDKGEFASLDEVAGRKTYGESALNIAHLLKEVAEETTSLNISEPAVGGTVVLQPGQAVLTVITDAEGIEYEVYVRERP